MSLPYNSFFRFYDNCLSAKFAFVVAVVSNGFTYSSGERVLDIATHLNIYIP